MKHIKLRKLVATAVLAGTVAIPLGAMAAPAGAHSVRASAIRGASISFQEGGAAGRVEDVILDPETGCARFAVIQLEGGRTVAAPYRVLRASGASGYVVTVTRDQLMNAPAIDLNRAEEFSAPEFSQRVYGYYRMEPEGGISVRERSGVRTEGEVERIREGQERIAPGAAGAARSPVGERSKKRNHGRVSATPTPALTGTAAATGTAGLTGTAAATGTAGIRGTASPTVSPSATPISRPSTTGTSGGQAAPTVTVTPAARQTPTAAISGTPSATPAARSSAVQSPERTRPMASPTPQ